MYVHGLYAVLLDSTAKLRIGTLCIACTMSWLGTMLACFACGYHDAHDEKTEHATKAHAHQHAASRPEAAPPGLRRPHDEGSQMTMM